MRDILALIVPWTTMTASVLALLGRDERRLSYDQRARAWPLAARLNAVVGLGLMASPLHLLALPIHFARTRRTVRGALVGVAQAIGVFAIGFITALAIDTAPDLPSPLDPAQSAPSAALTEAVLLYLAYRLLRRVA